MPSPSTLAYWEAVILIVGFCGVVVWKLMTGDISLDFLLYGDQRDPGSASGLRTIFSPGRAQLLTVTILTAVYYLLQVIHNPRVFPQVPAAWVAALGGSQAVYLVGKATSVLLGSVRDLLTGDRHEKR